MWLIRLWKLLDVVIRHIDLSYCSLLTCNMLTKYTSFLFNISSMNLINSSLNSLLLLSHDAWKCNPNGARLVEKCRLKLCLNKRPNCSPVWMLEHESTMWQPKHRTSNLYINISKIIQTSNNSSWLLTWQRLVKRWIVTPVQFIHDHLPYRMASARTVLSITVAFVRHSKEQSVWPNRYTAQRCCNGSVVHEELMFHHLKLFVSAYS